MSERHPVITKTGSGLVFPYRPGWMYNLQAMPVSSSRPSRSGTAPLFVLGLAVLFLQPVPSRAQDIPVTVEDALRMAIENNLDLRVQTFNPAIAATGIQSARAIYDTLFSTLLDYRGQNSQTIPDSDLVA